MNDAPTAPPLNTVLGVIAASPRDPSEPLRSGQSPLGRTVGDFWRWAGSDLVSNTFRGWLAEYIVACALDIDTGVRLSWVAYDLRLPDGTRIEIKASGYVQSWLQRALYKPRFSIREARSWDAETNITSAEAQRAADVYVFCLHAHTELATLDPLDVSQWRFFVVPTFLIAERLRSQKDLGLSTLKRLSVAECEFEHLSSEIRTAASLAKARRT
ncbi:MAG: hypothetical protein ABR526_11535 [Chthoniobacterales bacterium]